MSSHRFSRRGFLKIGAGAILGTSLLNTGLGQVLKIRSVSVDTIELMLSAYLPDELSGQYVQLDIGDYAGQWALKVGEEYIVGFKEGAAQFESQVIIDANTFEIVGDEHYSRAFAVVDRRTGAVVNEIAIDDTLIGLSNVNVVHNHSGYRSIEFDLHGSVDQSSGLSISNLGHYGQISLNINQDSVVNASYLGSIGLILETELIIRTRDYSGLVMAEEMLVQRMPIQNTFEQKQFGPDSSYINQVTLKA